ncbi:MAG: DUF255 domain-containing protein [Pedobacter sp.]|nr:MAG: DUF255 domain-containing protein [Pedobacter sp.]
MKYIYTTMLLLFFISSQSLAINFYAGDYKSALQKAKFEDKNVLLYFTAAWCGPCQYMQQNIFPDKGITSYVDANYVALKIDIDSKTGRQLYYKFEHEGVPDFYVISPDEKILRRKIGGMKVNQLKSFLAVEKVAVKTAEVSSDSLGSVRRAAAEKRNNELIVALPKLADRLSYKQVKPDSVAEADYRKLLNRRKTGFHKFFYQSLLSKWKPGLAVGLRLNSFNGYISKNTLKPGYQVGLLFNYTQDKFYAQPELQFSTSGGDLMGNRYALKNIEVPVTLGYIIGWHRLVDGKQAIWLNAVPYAGYIISQSSDLVSVLPDFNRWNYGVKAGLSLSMGSFLPAFGYDFGLSNLDKSGDSRVSTRAYYVSFALIIGR